jgi:hypothetical protein
MMNLQREQELRGEIENRVRFTERTTAGTHTKCRFCPEILLDGEKCDCETTLRVQGAIDAGVEVAEKATTDGRREGAEAVAEDIRLKLSQYKNRFQAVYQALAEYQKEVK